jgi:hypothetical protein
MSANVPLPNLPETGVETHWAVTPGPEAGIWDPSKLSSDAKGGIHMIGGTGEGRGPFDDFSGGPMTNSQW